MGQEREKTDAKACCWGYLSEQGNVCVVSVVVNAYCSMLTRIVPYALQCSTTLFCVFVLLWSKKKKKIIQEKYS